MTVQLLNIQGHVVVFFCVQLIQLRWEGIVCFVDIGGIDDHHCLNFLFIMYMYWQKITREKIL
jgi:hypothetical protein